MLQKLDVLMAQTSTASRPSFFSLVSGITEKWLFNQLQYVPQLIVLTTFTTYLNYNT